MKNFQDVLLPLQKPFEINAELTATNLLTSGNPLTSGSIADTPNSIAAPVSQTSTINFFTPQKVDNGKSFEQFLTQPQLLGTAANPSPSNLASSNVLTGDKSNILTSSDSDILTGKKLEIQASSIGFSQIPNTSAPERQAKNSNLPIGVFQVGTSGQVSLDYLFDGGYYQGELAIFSLSGMETLVPGSEAFVLEASRRALTNSTLGHIILRDSIEGAKFSGSMPGEYQWI